jgi:hypothetical protein
VPVSSRQNMGLLLAGVGQISIGRGVAWL